MNAFEAAALVGALWLPFHLLLLAELRRLPEDARRYGIAVDRREALEAHGEVIGSFRGSPIYDWVRFLGRTYRFERIVSASRGPRERELVLEPGLLYLTD